MIGSPVVAWGRRQGLSYPPDLRPALSGDAFQRNRVVTVHGSQR